MLLTLYFFLFLVYLLCLLFIASVEVDWSDLATVDLAAGGSEPSDYYGENVQAMGYGTTGNQAIDEDEDENRNFRTVTLRVIKCPKGVKKRQTDVICTEAPEAGDVCAGDSGGPLLYPIIRDGQPVFMVRTFLSFVFHPPAFAFLTKFSSLSLFAGDWYC